MSVVNIAETALADGFHAGNGTVGATEAKISAVAFPIRKHLVVRADKNNTNTVIVGTPGDAANGFVLNAGEQTPPIYVDSTDKVRVIGGAASQSYSWVSN
jgi:hypothetical protein